MRAAYSVDVWTRPASHEANVDLTEQARRYREILDRAAESDRIVRDNWEEWAERIGVLCWDLVCTLDVWMHQIAEQRHGRVKLKRRCLARPSQVRMAERASPHKVMHAPYDLTSSPWMTSCVRGPSWCNVCSGSRTPTTLHRGSCTRLRLLRGG